MSHWGLTYCPPFAKLVFMMCLKTNLRPAGHFWLVSRGLEGVRLLIIIYLKNAKKFGFIFSANSPAAVPPAAFPQ